MSEHDDKEACYGMGGCPHHKTCRLYGAVGIADGVMWATCWDGQKWPKFIPIVPLKE